MIILLQKTNAEVMRKNEPFNVRVNPIMEQIDALHIPE